MRLFPIRNRGFTPGGLSALQTSPTIGTTYATRISSAQILAGNTTPIVVIPAPGPGKIIYYMDGLLVIKQGGTDYATAHTVILKYKTAGDGAAVSTSFTSPFILSSTTVNKVCSIKQLATDLALTADTDTVNQPVVMTFSANPTLGTHKAIFFAHYAVLPSDMLL